MDSPPENDCCSICHDKFTLPCQANCSHWFCALCIIDVWEHGSTLRPCKCPMCRRVITLLIPSAETSIQRHQTEIVKIETYNRLFGGGSHSLVQRLRDLPLLVRRMSSEVMDPQRSLPFLYRTRMAFSMLIAVIYVLSPVDFLPEAVFGLLGFMDDLIILLVIFLHLAAMHRALLLRRHSGTRP